MITASKSGSVGQDRTFDAVVVGAGQAGPSIAARLTAAGMTVAIVERGLFGGTCVNTGCTPTKTMVASAYVARLMARAGEYGIRVGHDPIVNLQVVTARAAAIAGEHRASIERWLSTMERCTVFSGHARFEGPKRLRVGNEVISGEQVFLNVGGRALVPEMPGINDISYLTNADMIALDRVPRHLMVVGGSYIGLEFAQMFRRFGAEVTVVEKGPRLIAREDEVISDAVKDILEREGIKFRLGAECIGFKAHPDGAAIGVDCKQGERDISGSHVLLAVGRRPNTDDLGLETAGIKVDSRGYILVDDALRTSVEGVWALGDCNGRGAFTHTAFNDFEIVAANILEGQARSVADRIPVYALYIDPPLGRVGQTVAMARAAGRRVRIGERPMTRVARAVEKGEAQGLMRVVVDAETDEILGAAILGPGGDEAVHSVLQTMAAGVTYQTLARSMGIHPTVAELIPTILGELGPVL